MTKRQLVATILSGGMYPFPADAMYKNVAWAVDVANRVIEVTPEEPKDEVVEYLGLLVSEIHELRDEVAKLKKLPPSLTLGKDQEAVGST